MEFCSWLYGRDKGVDESDMAVTKIHGIKATVDKAIEYICNPVKTNEQIYVSSFACSPETAALDFKYTLDHAREQLLSDGQIRENKAFHLIQAFSPGEIPPKEAHTIGKELADQLLEGKYSYVLTTHIDKGHVHNHLIFCAADNIDHNHYHDCRKNYWYIRKLSDRLCTEHGLSVIKYSENRGMKYNEWSANQNEKGWKTQIRKDINQAIKASSTYNDFIALMNAKGYEMKNTSLNESGGKYIAFRPAGKDRFVRGSSKSLGGNFTKERIKERIENKKERRSLFTQSNQMSQLIDTTTDATKISENIGLRKWATKENLKIAAHTYSIMNSKNIHNFAELNERINALKKQTQTANISIISIEHQLRELSEIIKFTEQYHENKPYNDRYEKVKDKDKFLRKYESQIILFAGAEHMLQHMGIDSQHMKLENMKKLYDDLNLRKKQLSSQHKTSASSLKELEQIKRNMEEYLQISPQDQEKPFVSNSVHEL